MKTRTINVSSVVLVGALVYIGLIVVVAQGAKFDATWQRTTGAYSKSIGAESYFVSPGSTSCTIYVWSDADSAPSEGDSVVFATNSPGPNDHVIWGRKFKAGKLVDMRGFRSFVRERCLDKLVYMDPRAQDALLGKFRVDEILD